MYLQTEHRYLYLQALRQLITLKALEGAGSADSLQGRVCSVMPPLLALCDADEEGVRSMVSECLGRLALIAPAAVLPQLKVIMRHQEVLLSGCFRNICLF